MVSSHEIPISYGRATTHYMRAANPTFRRVSGKAGGGAARQTLISSFVVPSPKYKKTPLESPLTSTPVRTDRPVSDATEDDAGKAKGGALAIPPTEAGAEINNGHAEKPSLPERPDPPTTNSSATTMVCLPPKKSRRRLLEDALLRRQSTESKVCTEIRDPSCLVQKFTFPLVSKHYFLPIIQDNVEVARPASIGRRTRQSVEVERQDEHQTGDPSNRVTTNGQEDHAVSVNSGADISESKEKDFPAAGEKSNHESQLQTPTDPLVKEASDEIEETPQRKRSRPPKKDFR